FVADFIGETNFLQGSVTARGSDNVSVRLENGVTVVADSDEMLPAETPVSITVRPEKLHLYTNSATPADQNCFSGTVTSVVYIGTDTHYDVDVGAGQHVRVRQQNSAPGSPLHAREGETVSIGFAPEAARVLSR
ncbi:MAG: TOBE domain-containing protein, partial [Caldilineaceae bacterium]